MDSAISGTTFVTRNPSLLYNDFEDGLMMMDIDSGHYFDLDSIGSHIWKLLESPATIDQLCQGLMAEYDVDAATCRADTTAFVTELLEKGLVSAG